MHNETFIPDYEYCDLLKENASFHLKTRAGKSSYQSPEYKTLQSRLLQIELRISAQSIIDHAAYLFPKVGPE
jgi:hypothetical protein